MPKPRFALQILLTETIALADRETGTNREKEMQKIRESLVNMDEAFTKNVELLRYQTDDELVRVKLDPKQIDSANSGWYVPVTLERIDLEMSTSERETHKEVTEMRLESLLAF